ncbi:hypothetical protein Tco_1185526, partial [Tanacetum coccineum]
MVNHQKLDETINNYLELVDITIQNVQSNKKTVASTLDMVISLMKEVECKEKAAEQAKEEAAASGLHILARVDELKQSRNRVKETNNVLYQVMYAQKEALASELKELLFRISGMRNEGDKSLGMHTALEGRLASAIRDKEFADTEKLQKELCAQEALTNEENQMKKVEEAYETMIREAVKISKEYLIDRKNLVEDNTKDVQVMSSEVSAALKSSIKSNDFVWICQILQEISQKRTRERMSDQEAKEIKAKAREIMPQPST